MSEAGPRGSAGRLTRCVRCRPIGATVRPVGVIPHMDNFLGDHAEGAQCGGEFLGEPGGQHPPCLIGPNPQLLQPRGGGIDGMPPIEWPRIMRAGLRETNARGMNRQRINNRRMSIGNFGYVRLWRSRRVWPFRNRSDQGFRQIV